MNNGDTGNDRDFSLPEALDAEGFYTAYVTGTTVASSIPVIGDRVRWRTELLGDGAANASHWGIVHALGDLDELANGDEFYVLWEKHDDGTKPTTSSYAGATWLRLGDLEVVAGYA